jgi:hypothetical protein
MAALNSESFRVIAPKTFTALIAGRSLQQEKEYVICPSLATRTLVTPHGIYACPYKRGHQHSRIGDASVHFGKQWQSMKWKENIERINPSKDCRFYCVKHELNLLLLKLVEANDSGADLLPLMLSPEQGDVFV